MHLRLGDALALDSWLDGPVTAASTDDLDGLKLRTRASCAAMTHILNHVRDSRKPDPKA